MTSDPHPTTSQSGDRPGLVLTGERTVPGIPDERYWFQRHVIAYATIGAQLTDLAGTRCPTVFDAGCGEGYGLAMLLDAGATRVIGADLDEVTVDHVRATYAARDDRIEVHRAELMALPIADDEIDVTVSLQVIEHLHDIPGYLASLRRVTRPGGAIVIATPNRLTFTPDSDTPVNPFHTREFTAAELHDELTSADLEVVSLVGVFHGPELTAAQAALGRPLPDALSETPPEGWSTQLRRLVHGVQPDDFVVHADDLDASLDLIATTRVPAGRTARGAAR